MKIIGNLMYIGWGWEPECSRSRQSLSVSSHIDWISCVVNCATTGGAPGLVDQPKDFGKTAESWVGVRVSSKQRSKLKQTYVLFGVFQTTNSRTLKLLGRKLSFRYLIAQFRYEPVNCRKTIVDSLIFTPRQSPLDTLTGVTGAALQDGKAWNPRSYLG